MGKLVLFLADGTTVDVPLDRERVTIGRRADNDVCLPYPAVSGEHAQVVTILADSFLEDLGSTNGTLVNGRPIAKHFLSDHDQIDIGRQRLTYLSDNEAKPDPLPPDMVRAQLQGLFEKVTPAMAVPQVVVSVAGDRRPPFGARGSTLADEEPAGSAARAAMPAAVPRASPAMAAVARAADRPDTGARTSRLPPSASLRLSGNGVENGDAANAAASGSEAAAAPAGPTVRVLSGASTGRRVPFAGDELTIGRVGVQVAVVRKLAEGYRLVPLEGREPPRINGAPIAPEGSALHPGDTFEVAGVRLELSADA